MVRYQIIQPLSNLTLLQSSDYNFIRNGDKCEPAGPEPIPGDVCTTSRGTYMGSSGYRLIPGNTCTKSNGKEKDKKVEKDCLQVQPAEGEITHQIVCSGLSSVAACSKCTILEFECLVVANKKAKAENKCI